MSELEKLIEEHLVWARDQYRLSLDVMFHEILWGVPYGPVVLPELKGLSWLVDSPVEEQTEPDVPVED